jgi:uracil-DNA glycosylase family 4
MSVVSRNQSSTSGLTDLHQRIQNCYRCQTHLRLSIGKPDQMDRGAANATIMAIGQAPGRVALNKQVAFAGNSFTRLHSWFKEAGYQGDATQLRSEMYLTSLLKCAPTPHSRKAIQKCFGLCRSFLWEQLEFVKPQLVVVLGRDACDLLAQDDRSFSLSVGRVFSPRDLFGQELFPPNVNDRSRWIFLPHPSGLSRIMNEPGIKNTVIGALRRELTKIEFIKS